MTSISPIVLLLLQLLVAFTLLSTSTTVVLATTEEKEDDANDDTDTDTVLVYENDKEEECASASSSSSWVWQTGHLWDMYDELDCEKDREEPTELPIHQAETWKLLQDIYRDTVGMEASSLLPPNNLTAATAAATSNGFQVPIAVDHDTKAGRGIFAQDEIPRGALVWKSTHTARFVSPRHYRQYLQTLPTNLACDVIDWAYTRQQGARIQQQRNQSPSFVICVDLDQGSFTNGGEGNFDCNLSLKDADKYNYSGCELEFYANRDIRKGEELRTDYSSFAETHGWTALGLDE
jgi:hypothetical protein